MKTEMVMEMEMGMEVKMERKNKYRMQSGEGPSILFLCFSKVAEKCDDDDQVQIQTKQKNWVAAAATLEKREE